jgi:phosphatidylglycerol---prolipoprotein diacylglyceryl transferase
MLIHSVFDSLAWITSLLTVFALRRSGLFVHPVHEKLRFGYLAAVMAGAGGFAWIFGTANLWLSGIHQAGRSIEGALAGAVFAVELYKWIYGIKVRTGAIYALPVALGIAVGRIGCLLSGMDDFTYGIPTHADWGWDFGDGVLRHPVALYESLAMAGFALVYGVKLWGRSVFWHENGFYLLLIFYGAERFVLEFFKPYGALLMGLSLFQILSIAISGYGVKMIRKSDQFQ